MKTVYDFIVKDRQGNDVGLSAYQGSDVNGSIIPQASKPAVNLCREESIDCRTTNRSNL